MHALRLFCFSLLLILSACSDPITDVGLDLLEDETSAQVIQSPIVSFSESSRTDITGAAGRVLVGSVDDPLTGQITANAFLDYEGTFDGAPSDEITEVRLIFSQDYRYGDTLRSVTLGVHEILEEWNDRGGQSDTQLNLDSELLTVTLSDLRTTIILPDSWVQEHAELLKGDEFDAKFHGFALIQKESGQVIGLNSETSSLAVVTSSGTSTFDVAATLTQINRLSTAQVPDGLVLFQDGAGPFIDLIFDIEASKNKPINGAVVSVHALDRQPTPQHFVRPVADSLDLIAVPVDDDLVPFRVGTAQLINGEYRFTGAVVNVFFQSIIFGNQEVKHLELRAPQNVNSLNSVFLYGVDDRDKAPSLTLILPP